MGESISGVVGRLAPTPTGNLHLGNARTFLVAWLAVRAAGGRVIMRVEDIDRERVKPEYEQQQLDELRWLGLDWDEGPDVGGASGPYRQSERLDLYRDALAKLQQSGAVFPCVCSRKDLAGSAPHMGEEARYPGTCRGRFSPVLQPKDDPLCHSREGGNPERQRKDWMPAYAGMTTEPAWRLLVNPGSKHIDDLVAGGRFINTTALVGDFVVFRKNGWPAYQLAVVVDDAAMNVTQVVRGDDLLSSAARQMLLYEALGLTDRMPREWAHVPLVLDERGERMAKRNDSCALG
ncbi:MAG: tRNA glutamyl-Q(34) synthetase GluQRS, partial [Planctomycetes bacterium]|nr:tRNA glutamyl-Q(34) synthetase GluQRS [Planctomycetota bacterium]